VGTALAALFRGPQQPPLAPPRLGQSGEGEGGTVRRPWYAHGSAQSEFFFFSVEYLTICCSRSQKELCPPCEMASEPWKRGWCFFFPQGP
jgi:hypothetical protein